MAQKDKVKMAVIAGASYALRYKERKPSASESEVMSYVTKNMEKIVGDIEEDN